MARLVTIFSSALALILVSVAGCGGSKVAAEKPIQPTEAGYWVECAKLDGAKSNVDCVELRGLGEAAIFICQSRQLKTIGNSSGFLEFADYSCLNYLLVELVEV